LPGDLYFCKLTQPLTVSSGNLPNRKPHPLPYGLRNPYRNLKSENSQHYAQKPERNCTFMNSATWLKEILKVSENFIHEGLSQELYRSGFFIAKIGKY
jgi:hypothetical protein